jgi:hypothetical protein
MQAIMNSEYEKRGLNPIVGQSVNEYQSILLTRYLKEPRLPPSSTYYNNNSRKKKSTVSRGSRPFP